MIQASGAGHQIDVAIASLPGAEVKRQRRLGHGLHQHHLGPQRAQQGDQILLANRITAQNLVWARLPVGLRLARGAGAGQQIFDREIGPIGQFGERKTELLEDRDAGIVAVEITPLVAAEAPQQLQRLSPQPGVAEGGMGVGIKADRRGGDGHGGASK